MNSLIPVYRPDGRLYERVSPAQVQRQEASGSYAKVVRRRKGLICRAILRGTPDDPTSPELSTYQGTRFIYWEKLESGHHCWRHKNPDVLSVEAEDHIKQ